MTDMEKVIKALGCCIEDGWESCHNCPYYCGNCHECTTKVKSDVLAMLKAQEPRVMTLEEVERLSYEPVYYESKIIPPRWAIIEMNLKQDIQMLASSGRVQCDKLSYGKLWRCWTSRPTDEQREAILWNAQN